MKKSLVILMLASLLFSGCASLAECFKNEALNGLNPVLSPPLCLVTVPVGQALQDSRDRKAARHQSNEWEKARQERERQTPAAPFSAPVAAPVAEEN